MRECVERYGLTINRAGFARCPFHSGDRTPSLKIYPNNRGWSCFGCGQSGSVIDFVMKYFGDDFKSACVRLNADFSLGLPIDDPEPLTHRQRQKLIQLNRERREAHKRDTEETELILSRYETALDIFCACDYIMLNAPPWSDAWCLALKHKDSAKYELDNAEMGVHLLRERQRNNNTGLD